MNQRKIDRIIMEEVELALYEYDMMGDGLFSGLKNIARRVSNVFTNSYSPATESAVKKYGDYDITAISVLRTPIQSGIKRVLNLISNGTFNKYKERYDDIYHLFMYIELRDQNGNKLYVSTEKEPNIKWTSRDDLNNRVSNMIYYISNPCNFRQVIELTMKRMGNKFHTYSNPDNNCQVYIDNLCESIFKISNQDYPVVLHQFILQDVGDILSDKVVKISNSVTNLGHVVGRLTGGKKRKTKKLRKNRVL